MVVSSCTVLEDSDTGWKVFGGYRLHRNVAVELSLVDLGKFKAAANGVVVSPTTDSSEAHAYGASLDAVFIFPLSREFSISARLGIFRWNATTTITRTVPSLPSFTFSEDRKADGESLAFGAGVAYDFSENAGVRLEWQRFRGVGEEGTTGRADIDLVAASLLYRFR